MGGVRAVPGGVDGTGRPGGVDGTGRPVDPGDPGATDADADADSDGTRSSGPTGDRADWITLAHVGEPGDESLGRLVARLGPAEVLTRIRAGRSGLRAQEALCARLADVDPEQVMAQAERCGARIITPADRHWPGQLGDLRDRGPSALWVLGAGDLRLLALRSVSIVGARACTPYGQEVARSWAAVLADQGWSVVSGAAYGIDAAAHAGALAAGGVTVAVVAGGVDVAYPRAHETLLARIRDDGLIVSEVPPGQPVRRQRFLSRNRLIAAISRATLVVEAALRSGTTATARAAAAMNRPVLAVPGPVTSPASAGCHRMIRDGEALCVVDPADVLDLLDLGAGLTGGSSVAAVDPIASTAAAWDRLAPRERGVLDALPLRGGLDVDAVVQAAGLAPSDVIIALTLLAEAGLARGDDGRWRACRAR